MTISSTVSRVSYSGNGVTTVFSFPYLFLVEADLIVVLRDALGVETTKTLTTHYTTSGAGVQSGGSVTMLTAPAVGETLVIYRNPSLTQDLDLVDGDPLPVEPVEKRLDKLTMFSQRLADQISRSLVQKETDSAVDLSIPLLADRVSMYAGYDASGKPIAVAALSGTIAATAFIQTLLDDTTAAIARNTLGFTGAGGTVPLSLLESNIPDSKIENSVRFQSANQFTGGLACSVGANALTVSVKDIDGSDASATSPVYVGFGSATLSSGDYNRRTISAALSAVISNGSTLGLASAIADKIQIYLLDNAGTPEICFHGGNAVLGEDALYTTTAEGGLGAADTRYTLYSTTARTNVRIRHIATLTITATAGAYAATPTVVSLTSGRTQKAQQHEILLTGSTGHGGTNTKIRRFTTLVTTGTALTATQSAANGDLITVNEEGLYAIAYQDKATGGAEQVGISKNSTELTTAFFAIGVATQLAGMQSATALNGSVTCLARLIPGDIIRAHDAGGCDSSNAQLRMNKIAE